jgi:hypothetical protein
MKNNISKETDYKDKTLKYLVKENYITKKNYDANKRRFNFDKGPLKFALEIITKFIENDIFYFQKKCLEAQEDRIREKVLKEVKKK